MMRIYAPAYYDDFRCIAGACPDSCCQEWEIFVDSQQAEQYRSLPGALGDRLRKFLKTGENGDTLLTLDGTRCPMWQSDGLCRIQATLGEEALCQVCRDFPRLRHDYGDFVELGLELSCPEAARLLLSAPPAPRVCRELPGGNEPEYAAEAMAMLQQGREAVLALLDTPGYSVGEVLTALLLYSYDVDGALSFPEDFPKTLDAEKYLRAAAELPGCGDPKAVFDFYKALEILTPRWRRLLEDGPRDRPWDRAYLPLIRYFVERYYLQAVSDYDLAGRAKFIVLSCLMIRAVDLPLLEAAQLYSKEIENDGDNVNAILDSAFSHPAFNDCAVLAWVRG